MRKSFRGQPLRKASAWRGMTFVELIVILGIFGAVAGTVLFNYRDFNGNVGLQNLAQDIALQIKRAQTDAVSGKTPNLSTDQEAIIGTLIPPTWTPSYGVAFDYADHSKSFFLYFNKDGFSQHFEDLEDETYSGPCGSVPDSECLEEITITSGDFIDLVCFDYNETLLLENNDGEATCNDLGGEEPNDSRGYISFTRPRSNAFITDFDDGSGTMKYNILVRIKAPSGGHKYITVWQSGYISLR